MSAEKTERAGRLRAISSVRPAIEVDYSARAPVTPKGFAQLSTLVELAQRQLSAQHVAIIIWIDEGCTQQQIAERLDKDSEWVSGRVAEIREWLTDRGFDEFWGGKK